MTQVDPLYVFCNDWLLDGKQVRARVFNMLLALETAITDLPPIGFCNEPLLGSKYDGLSRNVD